MAAKLILSMDGAVLQEYVLGKERMTIGRKPHNDIVIDNLAVSGEHAAVVTILNDSFLEDLDSTNGVMVNGVAVKKHFLQNNDLIEIGKYKLRYLNMQQSQAAAAADDYEKTIVLRTPPSAPKVNPAAGPVSHEMTGKFEAEPPKPIAPPSVAAPAPAQQEGNREAVQQAAGVQADSAAVTAAHPAASAPQGQPSAAVPLAAVQILTGPNAGKELELVKNLTTLGKPGVQVVVVTRRPHGYFITHVEGANYPSLNGKTLDAHQHPLSNHDIIDLAGVKMEFFFKG
ncbi:Oxoglutarate dehydrogenase inhibitor [Gallionellaceae bacterium]|nr:Oxoglutarate dehydrogenase inhibitor [Gallionellaceae bacterium]